MWAGRGTADAPTRSSRRAACGRSPTAARSSAIVDEVLAANAKPVAEYRAGKDKAFNALVGQVMKATPGQGQPRAGQRAPAGAPRR